MPVAHAGRAQDLPSAAELHQVERSPALIEGEEPERRRPDRLPRLAGHAGGG
jgi:hypothetical protein